MLLKDVVVASGEPGDPSRFVHVASLMNVFSKFSPEDFDKKLHGKDSAKQGDEQYANSKLLQIFFSDELARQLKEEGANTESVVLHPGNGRK